ncbi:MULTISPECIES: VOC family protein [Ramlibacter]|uniref:VOC family protein n=1 Tax=Ramlibacter pinisoli TaxID=2682844 RepID=A0A6N8ISC3_9BURK|nr:VOC family protein [Ramlibacter sp. CGMCC 1.13660]MVQ29819.1 VOC family protein [Ramlibacter pinisoli]
MIDRIDHIVLTTAREAACIDFYTRVLGMALQTFTPAGSGAAAASGPAPRQALVFGRQKINLHVQGAEHEPKAHLPVPGSQDLCFLAAVPLAEVIARLEREHWPVVEGPVLRTGATGPIRSVYVRDPDLNLIEISEPA